jgi:hypothetical protein
MEIDVLYVPDCPNLDLLRGRLLEALARTGVDAAVRETEVSSEESAHALGMHGSPTLLINGRDPFAGGDEATSVSCRLYRTDGLIQGAPTVSELVAVVTAEAAADRGD